MKFVFAVLMCFLASVNGEANVNSERKLLNRRSLTKAESDLILSDNIRGTMDDLEERDNLRERRLHPRWMPHKHRWIRAPKPVKLALKCESNLIKKNGKCLDQRSCPEIRMIIRNNKCQLCGHMHIAVGNNCLQCDPSHFDMVSGNRCDVFSINYNRHN